MIAVNRSINSHPADKTVTQAERSRAQIVAAHRFFTALLDPANAGIDELLSDWSLESRNVCAIEA